MLAENRKKWKERWDSFTAECGRGLWLTVFAAVFVYGIRLVEEDLSIDTEIMLNNQQEMLDSWIGIGRFGLVFTKKLFGFQRLVPFTENLMMLLALIAAGIVLSFALWTWCGEDRRYRTFCGILPALFLTGPCFAEQFHFTLQAFPVAFAMGLAAAAVFSMEQWAWERRKVWWLAAGVLLGAWAAGTYQVLAAMEVALFAMAYFLRVTEAKGEKTWLVSGIRSAAAFGLTMALYAGLSAAVKAVTGSYSAYVEGQMHWGEGIRVCLHYILNDVTRILKSTEIFYHPWTAPVLAVFALAAGWRIVRLPGSLERKLCAWFSLAMAAASPFYLTVATGYYQPARAQLVYPLALAFWCSYLTAPWPELREKALLEKALRGKEPWEKEPCEKRGTEAEPGDSVHGSAAAVPSCKAGTGKRPPALPWLKWAACLLCAVIAVGQAQVTTGLFRTAAEVSRNDQQLLNRIYSRVEVVADTEDMSQVMILLVGKRDPVLSPDSLTGDTIGYSYFNWEDDILGVTGRIFTENGLGRAMGLEYGPVNTQSYENAVAQAEGRPIWPAKDSVWEVSEGVVAVKLGEE